MSDRQLQVQHEEIVARNRDQRLATQQEAQRLADERAARQDAVRQAQ